ncbi:MULTISPECIES: substrate-binding domain-containing protein [Vibrio]|uniref:substrate-binding domain-containing protein n=1 Tax=Vibrio TaxID=662 RepID=UPI00207651FB|nr:MULTISPECIES: substrate-binding domain-containing protein [Vibrio]USD33964.1 substrate-binding domain-containing protein [Vibrio sp. SCSIO 43186]USD44234.1 substrate-binding domain-containing protein [Vibrio sp. SCSIO 43145]USD71087.1 substrate-binding domain-containing protein [Vibrio sp. SCSIO 43139]USD95993.1 sugar ABC transporter substrate-binding protein [Vibrio coralliilyticus]
MIGFVRNVITLSLLLCTISISEAKLRFAVVPKEELNPFFDASREGCMAAAKELENVECIYRGPKSVDVRKQDKIIAELLDEGIDGIAIAVSQSEFMLENSMKQAKEFGVPVITYDADFAQETLASYPELRAAYIGTNDYELGEALGEQLKSQLPNGGTVIIQSGRPDSPNLNLRVMGVRSALSGKQYLTPPGERLKGENGWTEFSQPLYNFGQFHRALEDLKNVLNSYQERKIHAIVAVGGWAQFLEEYRDVATPHKDAILNKEIIIITADTAQEQLEYLKDNLAHVNIGQNPYEMGRQAILTLYKLANEQPVEEVMYIPMTYCTPENYQSCTKH